MFFNSKKRQEKRQEKRETTRKEKLIQEVVRTDPTFQGRLNRNREILMDSIRLLNETRELETFTGRYSDAKSAAFRLETMFRQIEAKNRMKNASLLAAELISMMPTAETPAHTEGYEGFYHINDIMGNESYATVRMIIRDHDREKFEARKTFITRPCTYLNSIYGEGSFILTLHDSYYNMKEKIFPHMELIENAKAAMEAAGVTSKVVPIRGGTDGARLSYAGIPCPNLSTGGVNFHSIHEFIPVDALERMVDVLTALVAM